MVRIKVNNELSAAIHPAAERVWREGITSVRHYPEVEWGCE